MNGRINPIVSRSIKASFISNCITSIHRGYALMISQNKFKPYWIEDKLTAHLIAKVKETQFLLEKNIQITPQFHLYDDIVLYRAGNPAKSPIIDFRFGLIWTLNEYEYFAEAKNLSEADWCKPKGSLVIASKYRARYINTGIKHYLTGYYPNGFLIGYVVNGNKSVIIDDLNSLIQKRNKRLKKGSITKYGLIIQDSLDTSSINYYSENEVNGDNHTIRHLILQLA